MRALGAELAEGVACSTPNELAVGWIMQHAHDIVTVTDDEALAAMRDLLQVTQNLAEGAGALAFAAIKKDQTRLRGQKVGCVLGGANASIALMARAMGI